MKVSEFIREYQVSGLVPTAEDAQVAFWGGWLIGRSQIASSMAERIEIAAKAAEFIEARARE